MSEEEEQPKRPEFRVVDKRISARGDAPAPVKEPSPQEPATSPAPPPQAAPEPQPAAQPTPQGPPAGGSADEPIWTPEQEAEAQRIIQEIGQRPSLDWVVNSAVTLANVAGTKLDLGQTADAQLAIDALAAIVEKLGPRFGQAETPLRQTLAQLQLAFAERSLARPPTPNV
jgi:hypothetical protein